MKNKYTIVLTATLLLQGAVYYAAETRSEMVPLIRPLVQFPALIDNWLAVQDMPLDRETLDVLKADDTLNRNYAGPDRKEGANLYMAYFRTQRTGQSPHSPKNCLPGAGWETSVTGFIDIDFPGARRSPITVNRYIVSRGEAKSIVLYWYQSHGRVIPSEAAAKFWLLADSIRLHRSDTALIRVIVPVNGGDDDAATALAVGFVRAIYPEIQRQFPS